jgi:hypothetical protein
MWSPPRNSERVSPKWMDERAGEKRKALEGAKKNLAIDERLAKLDPFECDWRDDVRVSREMVKRLSGE